jgi:extradiol dioxygenase family protein
MALEVHDLHKIRQYLEAKGATIREAVVMPDRNRFYLLDPFGNYFEFMEFK